MMKLSCTEKYFQTDSDINLRPPSPRLYIMLSAANLLQKSKQLITQAIANFMSATPPPPPYDIKGSY